MGTFCSFAWQVRSSIDSRAVLGSEAGHVPRRRGRQSGSHRRPRSAFWAATGRRRKRIDLNPIFERSRSTWSSSHRPTERFLAERGEAWSTQVLVPEDVGKLLAEIENRISAITSQLAQDGADVVALVERLGKLKVERTVLSKPQRRSLRVTNVHHDWKAATDVNERRALLLGYLDELTVASRGRTSHRFDPTRVTLTWRPDPYDEELDLQDQSAHWG